MSPLAPARARHGHVCVYDADPDLFAAAAPDAAAPLRARSVVPARTLEPGAWDAWSELREHGASAVLIVDGLLARRVAVGGRRATELLGPGDPIRPWLGLGATSLSPAIEWRALTPSTIAVLDRRFAALASQVPGVASVLVDRLVIRSGWLAFQLAVCQATSVRRRVLAMLWSFGDRWGRMTRGGVLVPVRLTHEVLGQVVGARRPSVTAALGDLNRAGRVSRCPEGWLLHGEPPAEVANGWAGAATASATPEPLPLAV